MKGKTINREITFECNYEVEDCYYKNPINKYCCVGCRFSRLIKQTPPKIGNHKIEDKK